MPSSLGKVRKAADRPAKTATTNDRSESNSGRWSRLGAKAWRAAKGSQVLFEATRLVLIADDGSRTLCLAVSHSRIGRPIGAEKAVPKIIDDREIAAGMPVMNEVQFLLVPEPGIALKPRSFYVVLLVEKDMSVERGRTCQHHDREEIEWQDEVHTRSDQKDRSEEKRRIVSLVTEVLR